MLSRLPQSGEREGLVDDESSGPSSSGQQQYDPRVSQQGQQQLYQAQPQQEQQAFLLTVDQEERGGGDRAGVLDSLLRSLSTTGNFNSGEQDRRRAMTPNPQMRRPQSAMEYERQHQVRASRLESLTILSLLGDVFVILDLYVTNSAGFTLGSRSQGRRGPCWGGTQNQSLGRPI